MDPTASATKICKWWRVRFFVLRRKQLIRSSSNQSVQNSAATIIQSFWRSKLSRNHQACLKCAARVLQRFCRGFRDRNCLGRRNRPCTKAKSSSLFYLEAQKSFVPVGYRVPSSTFDFQRRVGQLQVAVKQRSATRIALWWRVVTRQRRAERHAWRLQRLTFLNAQAITIQRWFRGCLRHRKFDLSDVNAASWKLVSNAERIAACNARHAKLRNVWLEASGSKRTHTQLPPLTGGARVFSAPMHRRNISAESERLFSYTSRLNPERQARGRYVPLHHSIGRRVWNDSPHLEKLKWCAEPSMASFRSAM